jgi:ElaB/YqjD/DUF883 family membrane-anchored ribosome-binding protein
MSRMHDRFDSLKDRLGDAKDSVVSGARTGASKTTSLIKEHPIIAIAIAFGVGYLAVRIMRR